MTSETNELKPWQCFRCCEEMSIEGYMLVCRYCHPDKEKQVFTLLEEIARLKAENEELKEFDALRVVDEQRAQIASQIDLIKRLVEAFSKGTELAKLVINKGSHSRACKYHERKDITDANCSCGYWDMEEFADKFYDVAEEALSAARELLKEKP